MISQRDRLLILAIGGGLLYELWFLYGPCEGTRSIGNRIRNDHKCDRSEE
jgi:hypothetical protein